MKKHNTVTEHLIKYFFILSHFHLNYNLVTNYTLLVSAQNSCLLMSVCEILFVQVVLLMQVVPSSLLADQQASLPESQEIQTNGDAAAEDSPMDADQSDSTDSEMENDGPAADGEVVCVRV